MFTIKLINSSLKSTRLAHRHISNAPGKALGFFKDKTTSETSEIAPVIEQDDENNADPDEQLRRIDEIRNKSGLQRAHRNMLIGKVPYVKAESWVHDTLKYQRKLYGKFGSASNVDPRMCFWTPTELHEKQEYEKVAYPKTVPEMIAINEQEKREKQEKIQIREAQIAKNLEKLEHWKTDIETRKYKKETEARVAKERKDRLIEEVRRHFGYTIDPRDERFKEMLELKEKEQRKALKESKRQAKESKLMTKLIETNLGKGDQKKTSEDVEAEKK